MANTAAATSMPFLWEGTDRNGKKIKGKSLASDEATVRADLRRRGVVPTKIRKQRKGLFAGGGTITSGDISIFSRQLATMLAAGIPLVQAFEIVGALAKQPLYFDDLFVNLVEAGEQAGALESLLDKIATYKEKTEAIKKKIKKALTYPAAVLAVAFIVTTILLIFVIPSFEDLFQGFGADLPAFTRMIIDLSFFVRSNGIYIVMIISAAVATFLYFLKRSRPFRHFLDRVMLKAPVIGPILEKAAIARYARTLSTMFAAGVPLVEALESVAGATGNIVFEVGVLEIRDEVATGQRLQVAMENTGLFPNMVIQMIAVGEESGSLDAMSAKVADFYEADVDDAVDNLSSLLEPMIMAILGVLVGGLVVAMYLPIFKLGAVV